MSAVRLTPQQQRVLGRLAEGLVLRSLAGCERYFGLFRPEEKTAEPDPPVRPLTIVRLGERVRAYDQRTGLPLPTPRTPGYGVEYRLAQSEGGAS